MEAKKDEAIADVGLAPLAKFIAQQDRKPMTIDIRAGAADGATALLVPDGYRMEDAKWILDAFRLRPALRAGATILTDLASFIAWTKRHMDEGSMIFADDNLARPSLTAIIDFDAPGAEEPEKKARWGRHRATYAFPYSREWQEWTAASKTGMSAGDFAAFFERRIGDVMPPPYSLDGQGIEVFSSQDPEIKKLAGLLEKKFATPSEIVKLTRGIQINVDATAAHKVDRDTGEYMVEFSEANGQGVDRIKPPNAFLIAIPVLHNGPAILLAVHLRYRTNGGKVTWFIELHQPERVFEQVFGDALKQVAEDTELTPLRGIAPAIR